MPYEGAFVDGWQLMAAYNFSSSTGNVANDFQGTTTRNRIYNSPNEFIRANWPSRLDAPHQFKLQGTYTLPYDVLLSGFYQAQTGFPIKLIESDQSIQGSYKQRFYPLCPSVVLAAERKETAAVVAVASSLRWVFPESWWRATSIRLHCKPVAYATTSDTRIDVRVEKQFPFGDGLKTGAHLGCLQSRQRQPDSIL